MWHEEKKSYLLHSRTVCSLSGRNVSLVVGSNLPSHKPEWISYVMLRIFTHWPISWMCILISTWAFTLNTVPTHGNLRRIDMFNRRGSTSSGSGSSSARLTQQTSIYIFKKKKSLEKEGIFKFHKQNVLLSFQVQGRGISSIPNKKRTLLCADIFNM